MAGERELHGPAGSTERCLGFYLCSECRVFQISRNVGGKLGREWVMAQEVGRLGVPGGQLSLLG